MLLGVFSGLAAALFQDCGYILSRIYIKKRDCSWNLLVYTQILMGGVSLVLLPFLWTPAIWNDLFFLIPLFLSAYGSFFGQRFFMRAEKHIEPARISSMMALRVVLLAIVSALFLGAHYDWMQVAGILLAPIAAFLINWENGRIRMGGMQWLGIALLFYCISDLSVKYMIDGIEVSNIFLASLIAMCLLNILLGFTMIPFVWKKWDWKEIPAAAPFAGSWFLKQFFLYACYALIGPVHGNIILSLRGPIAIILTLILLRFHVQNLDNAAGANIWIRRSIATLMMLAAILLYTLNTK